MNENQKRTRVRNLLAAQAALDALYHASGDKLGLELARQFEREAHDIFVGLNGGVDAPTHEVAAIVVDDSQWK